MIWIDNINMLDYYQPTNVDAPCYCEVVLQPEDLLLQIPLGTAFGVLTVALYVYSADGNENLGLIPADAYWTEEITDSSGNRYITIKFKRFPDVMCANPCFIIRGTVSRLALIGNGQQSQRIVFDKFTQRYCMESCCIVPSGITYEIDGQSQFGEYDERDYSNEYYNID